MIPLDIPGLRRALAAGSPAPWRAEDRPDPSIYAEEGACVVYQVCSGAIDNDDSGQPNAALIVAAVNALPAILDRLEALERVVKKAAAPGCWRVGTWDRAGAYDPACQPDAVSETKCLPCFAKDALAGTGTEQESKP